MVKSLIGQLVNLNEKVQNPKERVMLKNNIISNYLENPLIINALKGNTVSGYILAPTQSLLQKWLREYHDLSIKIDDFITDSKIRYDYSISVLGSQTDNPTGLFESYEEALEEGLQKMLLSISVNHAKM